VNSTRIQIVGCQVLTAAVVAGLGICLIVAGGINIILHGLALPFATAQSWAARKIRALK
jgi:hypothetical protein